jgi:hypothetical protein
LILGNACAREMPASVPNQPLNGIVGEFYVQALAVR